MSVAFTVALGLVVFPLFYSISTEENDNEFWLD